MLRTLRLFGPERYCAGACELITPVTLPSGAQIIGIEVDAFDNDAGGQVNAMLNGWTGDDMCFNVTGAGTSDSATPGQTQIRNTEPVNKNETVGS